MKRSLCTYVVLASFACAWMVAPARASVTFVDSDIDNLTITHEIVHATHQASWEGARSSWVNARFRELSSDTVEARFIQPNTPPSSSTNYAEFIMTYYFSDLSSGGPTNVVLFDKLFFAAFTTDANGNAIDSQTITVFYREGTSGAWTETRSMTALSGSGSTLESNLTYSIALNSPDVFQYRVVYTVQGDENSVFSSDGQHLRWGFVRNNDADLTAFKLIFQFADEDIVVSGFSVTPGGVASVTFTSVNGVDYVLQHTTDLAGDPPAWLDATGPDAAKTGDGNALTLEDADPADPVRAYRLVTP